MLTLNDCIALSELLPEEIEAISRHEHVTFIVALEKGHNFLDQPWGPPAIRQILYDSLAAAMRANRAGQCVQLMEIYSGFHARHPGGTDRRHCGRPHVEH